MYREILFKAKSKYDGEWIEGDLSHGPEIGTYYIEDWLGEEYCCDTDTICQYTGLTDKNGKRIWENDIVKTNQYGVDKGDGRNFSGFDNFHVSFSECSFCLMNKWRRFNLHPSNDLEVIGNVFDNPDLLNL